MVVVVGRPRDGKAAHQPLLPPQPTSIRPSFGGLRSVLNWYSVVLGVATCSPREAPAVGEAPAIGRWILCVQTS